MQYKLKISCHTCYYNFDGLCAQHGYQKNGDDTYGMPIEEMLQQFSSGCSGYRISYEDYCILKNKGVIS